MSRVALPAALACKVATHHLDSDRRPLTFPPPASSSAEVSSLPLPPTASTLIPNFQWDGASKGKCVQHMKERDAAVAYCHSKLHAHQLDSASHQLGSIMNEAASEAGFQTSSGAGTPKGNKGKRYCDHECWELSCPEDKI